MPIQWFPGHMNVTKKAIIERIKDTDVVIELLDARLPGSSANPMLEQLTGHRLKLKVLNKQDLADATQTEAWLAWYNAQPNTRAIALDAGETAPAQRLIKACRELAPHRGGMAKPLRVMICGIPNVGKSTLMNTLVGRKAAKTGDEAGVTRVEQRINLASDFYLFDTPGMLWPKITVDQSGYHLAASGAVGRNAYEDEDVALELLKSLREPYAAQLAARFKLDDVAAIPTTDEEVLLSEVGRKRGAVMGGGRINIAKAAEIVLHDFRAGLIGRITLETPEQFAQWWAEGQAKEAEREAAKLARKQKKHGSRKPADADADVDDDEEEDESDEG
ncbi:MAG TPA: ribosome biogenesis GTPase YlqF [Aquabacterium sp.]|nr:ribosome biogenesis GTPase YlqF [Aquabacterium sp.]